MGVQIIGFHAGTGKGCGCCGTPLCTCGSCSVPQENLTVSWTNPIAGNGSATLVYSSCVLWESGCTNQLLYELVCTGSSVEFRVYYFLAGSCPTGTSQYCSTLRSSPNGLTRTGLTCGSSFLLTCTTANCTQLGTLGYTSFSVSYP
jgi:hypothetical protein